MKALIIMYENTFNPVNPSPELRAYLDSIITPSKSTLNPNTRKKAFKDLSEEQIEYLATKAKHITDDLRRAAIYEYFIRWYKELTSEFEITAYIEVFKETFPNTKEFWVEPKPVVEEREEDMI